MFANIFTGRLVLSNLFGQTIQLESNLEQCSVPREGWVNNEKALIGASLSKYCVDIHRSINV